MEKLSLRGYARHRKSQGLDGTTLAAVQKAVKRGSITLDADGKIDPEVADRDWKANSRHRWGFHPKPLDEPLDYSVGVRDGYIQVRQSVRLTLLDLLMGIEDIEVKYRVVVFAMVDHAMAQWLHIPEADLVPINWEKFPGQDPEELKKLFADACAWLEKGTR